MLNKLKLILNNGKIMKRVLITVLIIFVFKIVTYIPIPLLETTAIDNAMKNGGFLSFLNAFSGNALGNYSIAALGISPYITASIVIQMLQMDIVPAFKRWGEEGEAGRAKINQATRYVAIGLAFLQALMILVGLSANAENIVKYGIGIPKAVAIIFMAIMITAGSAFVMWLADLITRFGIGNGSSIIITAGIITSLPSAVSALWQQKITEATGTYDYVVFGIVVFLYIAILVGVVYMEKAVRKIPTQYANRQGKSDSHIPIKLNTAGVMPVIFASTLLSIPATIMGFAGVDKETTAGFWLDQIFTYNNPLGFAIYMFLVFIFSFFYTFLTVKPDEIADDLQKSNAFIPGIRPGEDTQNYIAKVLFKVTVLGATYLAILAAIPIISTIVFKLPQQVSIGGTSILIIVGVAIETAKQLETEASEKAFKGFM
ncbi:MAG: preprotein translocase subunit SecY [bacterium]|nr:preprotein translocase subunit SecY [bacterium]